MKLITTAFLALAATCALAQVVGGAAYQERRGGASAALATELAKRVIGKDETGRYLEASVLMNVRADEYVAVFAISEESKTLEEARKRADTAATSFLASSKALRVAPADMHVDFIAQNRIYGYEGSSDKLLETVVGFEVKMTVSIHYRDPAMLDRLLDAASKAGIYDLVKVDYIVTDIPAIRKRLLKAAGDLLRRKKDEQETLLGIKVGELTQAYPPQFGMYLPTEMYESYVAQESEDAYSYRQNATVVRARKPKTFYFNGLSGKEFDDVINPVLTEPMVQFTIYVRVKY